MTLDPSKMTVAEIRERLVRDDARVTPGLLRKLQRDRRRGVRSIYETLRRRHQLAKAERSRLEALLDFERVLWRSGIERLAGVDEAGVGPLAGPVVAAAVVFPPGTGVDGVDDSKRLDAGTRERLAPRIREAASGVGVGVADVGEIDEVNVYRAALLAMRRAVEALPEPPQHLLVDARTIPGLDIPQNDLRKGDGIDFSIAAASIIAKTHRDALMVEIGRRFPAYGFERHKGYATAEHQLAIREHGPCAAHRRSYAFIRELCGEYSDLFYALQRRLEAAADRRRLRAFGAALDEAREQLSEDEHRKLRLSLNRRWQRL